MPSPATITGDWASRSRVIALSSRAGFPAGEGFGPDSHRGVYGVCFERSPDTLSLSVGNSRATGPGGYLKASLNAFLVSNEIVFQSTIRLLHLVMVLMISAAYSSWSAPR